MMSSARALIVVSLLVGPAAFARAQAPVAPGAPPAVQQPASVPVVAPPRRAPPPPAATSPTAQAAQVPATQVRAAPARPGLPLDSARPAGRALRRRHVRRPAERCVGVREPRWSSRDDAGQSGATRAHCPSGEHTGDGSRRAGARERAACRRDDAVQGRHVPLRSAIRGPLRRQWRPRGRPSGAARRSASAGEAPVAAH